MNFLVTGADGFVGNALCQYLLSEGKNVSGSLWHEGLSVPVGVNATVVGDLNSETKWEKVLNGIDVVVHTAARVHVMNEGSVDPLSEYRKVNVEGTAKLAKSAAQEGVKRFVYISSIKVNGELTSDGKPFKVDSDPVPLDPYGISKFEAEEELKKISKDTGMEFVIVRPPLIYGPGVKANFHKMISWVMKGVPLPFGSVKNKRSFIALENLVDFLYRCAIHPKAANQTFLISDGRDMSTAELLKKVAIAVGKRHRVFPFPVFILAAIGMVFRKKDVVSRLIGNLQVDSTPAFSLLGWKPVISIDEALKKVAEGYFS
mgnify:CR=1 FL=1